MTELTGLTDRDPNEDAAAHYEPVVKKDTPVIPVMVDLVIEAGQLVFKMQDKRAVLPAESVIGHTDEAGYYIRVRDQDIVIELELSPWWDWEFDGDKPFTLKQKKNGIHDNVKNFHVRKWTEPRKMQVEMKRSGQPVQISGPGFKQGYNLYVKMGQPKGEALPIRIDPIVKNPPPVGGMNAPAGVLLPI